MKKIAILIATTNGPILVERITPEPAPQSMVCLSRQSLILPISGDYEDFVRLGSGVIIREFPLDDDMSFRMDLSGEITSGLSWQLGVFAAHAVFHSKSMELSNLYEADEILWLSGTVDYDLNIGAIDHIDEKVEASIGLLAEKLAQNIPITFVMHPKNAADVKKAKPPSNIEILELQNAKELLLKLGLKKQKTKPKKKTSEKTAGFWAMAGVAIGAILVLFYLREPQKEEVYVAPKPSTPERLTLDIFSEQGQFAAHRFGDDLDLWFKTNKKAWIYCFYHQVDGNVLQIYPNAAVGKIKSFEPVVHHHLSGSENAEFVIRLGPPAGDEKISCYASTQDLTLRLPTSLRGQSMEPLSPFMAGSYEDIFAALKDIDIASDTLEISLKP